MGKKPQRVDSLQFDMKAERTKVIEERLHREKGGVVKCYEPWLARRFGLSDRAHYRNNPILSDLTKMVNAGVITFTTQKRKTGKLYVIKLVKAENKPDSQPKKRRRKR